MDGLLVDASTVGRRLVPAQGRSRQAAWQYRQMASRALLHVELMAGADLLEGPAAAAVDVLRMVNAIAALRGQRRPAVAWQWSTARGTALRRPGSGGRRVAWPDVLLLPGWAARSGAHLSRVVARDVAAASRVRAVHDAGGHVLAVFTGVALAGEAGLTEGRRALVPWPFMAAVRRHAPGLVLADGESVVQSERLWTADSPVATTDLLLRVLQAAGLGDLAESARVVLTHAPERQRLARAVAEEPATRLGPGALERARRWLEDHLHEPYSLAATARAAATSERSLLRHFRAVFGGAGSRGRARRRRPARSTGRASQGAWISLSGRRPAAAGSGG
jgi:transcriptional regulator GlxA family with amidase domain